MLLTHANSRLDVKLVVSLKKESGKLYGVRAQSGKVYSPQPPPPPPQITKQRSSDKVYSPQPSPLNLPKNEAAARFALLNPPRPPSNHQTTKQRQGLLSTTLPTSNHQTAKQRQGLLSSTPPPPPNHQTTTLLDSRYAPGVFVFHHGRRSI